MFDKKLSFDRDHSQAVLHDFPPWPAFGFAKHLKRLLKNDANKKPTRDPTPQNNTERRHVPNTKRDIAFINPYHPNTRREDALEKRQRAPPLLWVSLAAHPAIVKHFPNRGWNQLSISAKEKEHYESGDTKRKKAKGITSLLIRQN